MNSINNKLQLYNNTYVKGECRSQEYESKIKREKRLNQKLDLVDTISNDLPFKFTQTQKHHVKHLIKTFPNYTELHSKATNEEITLSFILYVKSLETLKEINLNSNKIQSLIKKHAEDMQLFPKKYEIIKWKITLHYIQKQPILPTNPKHIDHNILYKG